MERLHNHYLPKYLQTGMVPIFIGWDDNEIIAYHVLAHSIIENATKTPPIVPLKRNQLLGGPFTRDRDAKASTDFADTRFLVPYLCNYQGYAIFMDCDMLCLGDIEDLISHANNRYAVQVVKHNYVPQETKKFLNQDQHPYPKKLWSAVMLFNNERCRPLTVDYINEANGLDLHQFKWLGDDSLIGDLPSPWHYVVGHDNYEAPELVHFTLGGPYFHDYRDCEYSDTWRRSYERMRTCTQAVNKPLEAQIRVSQR